MLTKVIFEYDEPASKWEVFVEGVVDDIEARQAFNAVIITASRATPRVDANRAAVQPDGRYKISVGV